MYRLASPVLAGTDSSVGISGVKSGSVVPVCFRLVEHSRVRSSLVAPVLPRQGVRCPVVFGSVVAVTLGIGKHRLDMAS